MKLSRLSLQMRAQNLRHRLGSLGIVPTRSQGILRDLRNAHSGRRGFILGNGPSLTVADMSRLGSEITFASNKIYLAYESTSWRPSYYSVIDKLVAQNNAQVIRDLGGTKIVSDAVQDFLGSHPSFVWMHELFANRFLHENPETSFPADRIAFSRDAMAGVEAGYSVVYAQLQLAFHMGIREVYLLGVDFSFSVPQGRKEGTVLGSALVAAGEKNHFHPDYRKPGEIWAMPQLECQYQAFQGARLAFETAGGRVWNASRTTKLDVFPLANLDEVLGGFP